VNLKVTVNTICDFKILFGDSEGIILKIGDFKTQSGDCEGFLQHNM